MHDLSDADLVGLALSGNRDAYGELVTRYQGHVYGLAHHLTGDWDASCDIAQDAFVRAYVNLGQLRDPGRFAPWLRRVTFAVAMDWLRKQGRELLGSLDEITEQSADGLVGLSAPGPSVPEQAQTNELRKSVISVIDQLPPHLRVPLTLFHMDGLSYQRVADFLEIPLGTVKRRIHEAKKRLRSDLEALAAEVLEEHKPTPELKEEVMKRIAGRVVASETGSPLPNVEVSIAERQAISDADGRYVVDDLPEGWHRLSLSPIDGYLSDPAFFGPLVRVVPGATETTDLCVEPGVVVSGRVVDTGGRPIVAAKVCLCESLLHIERVGHWPGQPVETDDDGRFVLPAVLPGTQVRLLAWHDEHADTLSDLMVLVEDRGDVEVRMTEGGRVSGQVVDTDGQPVVGAAVHLYALRQRPGSQTTVDASSEPTGTDGKFTVLHAPPGYCVTHLWSQTRNSPLPVTEPTTLAIKDGQAIDGLRLTCITRSGSAVTRGRVVDDTGAPIADARITLHGSAAKERTALFARTDTDGRYEVTQMPGGRYTGSAYSPSHSHGYHRMFEPGDGIDFVLDRKGTVQGQVVDPEGQPLRDFEVAVMSAAGKRRLCHGDWPQRFISAEGEFSATFLPGTVTLEIRSGTCAPQRVEDVQIESGQTTDVGQVATLPGTDVRGQVVDGVTGRGRPGVLVTRGHDYPGVGSSGALALAHGAFSAAGGRFTLSGVAPGRREFLAIVSDREPAPFQVEAVTDRTPEVRVELQPGATVAGQVLDPREEPFADCHIIITCRETDRVARVQKGQWTDAEGRYEIDGLPPGFYLLSCHSPHYIGRRRARNVHVTLAEQEQVECNFDYRGNAAIRGHVRDRHPAFSGMHVNVGQGEPQGKYLKTGLIAAEIHDTRFEFGNLPAGPARLFVYTCRDNAPAGKKLVDIELRDGETLEIEVEIGAD